MPFHLVKVMKNVRCLIQTVDDIEKVIPFIEDQYSEHCEFLENVDYDDFKKAVEESNKYESGLYIVEHPDCINVYRVSTKIYYGYLYNCAEREIKLIDRYELVLDHNNN